MITVFHKIFTLRNQNQVWCCLEPSIDRLVLTVNHAGFQPTVSYHLLMMVGSMEYETEDEKYLRSPMG
jgi:hypothetical protein